MAEIFNFVPRHELDAKGNLVRFINACREKLTVFGADLDWDSDYWPNPGITFGNLDQKSRKLDPENIMKQPFLDFAKAYFRYMQGHKSSASFPEMRALKCLERALVATVAVPDIQQVSASTLDNAAILARENFSPGLAYHVGRELAKLASFVSEKYLVPTRLDWKTPMRRPVDTVRTGRKAKAQREKKLPSDEALNALSDIFASNPVVHRDIFTTSVSAMLLCAPSRITEILTLPVDCEVWETKRDGKTAYGWRFQPGKGGAPMIKWIPEPMVGIAQEAISRIRQITEEARRIALWYEEHPDLFYRHTNCPDVNEHALLTVSQTAQALDLSPLNLYSAKSQIKRYGLEVEDDVHSLSTLNIWVHTRLPQDFPLFDKERGIRFSNALFCMNEKQLRTDMGSSVFMIWKPTVNVFNNDLGPREVKRNYIVPTIFDRHGYNAKQDESLKITSHQFRHLLNTMAQRGGLSQSEIARWSGRVDMKQNRSYDHMSEFELVEMIRSNDQSLSLDRPLQEISEQISARIPMTRQEFNTLSMPTAHVTEYGFCVHDFVMSPCQRFRDCLNCSEQVCIKGDHRVERIRVRHSQVKVLADRAEREISEGVAGADRWYEIHQLTEKRLAELISIFENPNIPNGTIIRLRNEHEFSPWRRAVETKISAGHFKKEQQALIEGLQVLLGDCNG